MADYIGARYTIKVYENSLDPSSAEWENGFAYEPLILVTRNNSSYLSKVSVPATAGAPENEPTYWAETGAYNGQILNLQNQINAINSVLAKVHDHVWIFVGDSFGESPSLGQDWETFTVNALENFGVKSYRCHISGGSFGNSVKYLTALQGLTVDDPNEITDIMVVGGYNDLGVSEVNVTSGMNAFVTYAKATYPNAKIHYAPHALCYTNGLEPNIDLRNRAVSAGRANGVTIVNDMWLAFRDYSLLGADHIHPIEAGSRVISDAVLMYCTEGGIFTKNEYGSWVVDYNTGFMDVNNTTLSDLEIRSKDSVDLIIVTAELTFASAIQLVINTPVANITTPKYVYGKWGIWIPVSGTGIVSGADHEFHGALVINGGGIALRSDDDAYYTKVTLKDVGATIPFSVA